MIIKIGNGNPNNDAIISSIMKIHELNWEKRWNLLNIVLKVISIRFNRQWLYTRLRQSHMFFTYILIKFCRQAAATTTKTIHTIFIWLVDCKKTQAIVGWNVKSHSHTHKKVELKFEIFGRNGFNYNMHSHSISG